MCISLVLRSCKVAYFIKIVHASIIPGKCPIYTSLCVDSRWCVEYIPQREARATLKHSKLFIFQNMKGTFDFLSTLEEPWRPVDELPFTGKMLWWCTAKNPAIPDVPLWMDPPDDLKKIYWDAYPYDLPPVPKLYKRRTEFAYATLFADGVTLISPCTVEEIKRLLAT